MITPALCGPFRGASRVGDDEQDIFDVFVLEAVSDFLVLIRVVRLE
jgi:hypothetical protein